MPKTTFAKAHQEILGYLQSIGWDVKAGLKVPHATSPDGKTRLWFKKEAVYTNFECSVKDFGEARSLWIDARDFSPVQFVQELERTLAAQMAASVMEA